MATTLPRCCWKPREPSNRSTSGSPAPRISRRTVLQCSRRISASRGCCSRSAKRSKISLHHIGEQGHADLLLEGLALMHTDGQAVAIPILKRAANTVADMPVEQVLVGLGRTDGQPGSMGFRRRDRDLRASDTDRTGRRRTRRAAGFLNCEALDRAWRGDLAGARLLVAERETVSAVTGSRLPPIAGLRLLALQGNEAEASALIDETIEKATAARQGLAVRGWPSGPRQFSTTASVAMRRPRRPRSR